MMKPKTMLKMSVDVMMTVLVLIQMAYHITGNTVHEWLGTTLFVLFLLHHILNLQWYRGLFKGKYPPIRILSTTVNMLLLIAMVCIIASGIMLSREVFTFLGFRLSAVGRPLHMLSTSWGFLLLSVHMGLHWGMILGMFRKATKQKRDSKVRTIFTRLLAVLICLRGVYAFAVRRMWEDMFLVNQFSFFDYSEPAWLFFIDYISIMGLLVCIAYYGAKSIRKLQNNRRREVRN